jgi:hypothetical protein
VEIFHSPRSILRANGFTKCGPYLLASSLAAALLDDLFDHPATTVVLPDGSEKTGGEYNRLFLVPEAGIEPAWSFWNRGILSPLRLPISPLRQGDGF